MQQVGRWLTAVVVVAVFVATASFQSPGASAQAEGNDFVLNSVYWPVPEVEFRVNLNGAPPGALDAVLSAAETWNSAPGSQVELRYVGTTTVAQSQFDGINAVYFAPLAVDLGPDGPLGRTSSQIARACNTCPEFLDGFDIHIATNRPVTVGALDTRNFDLESVMVHEFGHALGFDHPNSSSQVMFSILFSGTEVRSLGPGDERAVQIRYPDSNADVNCDSVVNILDALAVAQYAVDTRDDVGRCPAVGSLGSSSLFALMGNANSDGEVNIADAFQVAKCAVGLVTPICNG